jgi:hypothetical protein
MSSISLRELFRVALLKVNIALQDKDLDALITEIRLKYELTIKR